MSVLSQCSSSTLEYWNATCLAVSEIPNYGIYVFLKKLYTYIHTYRPVQ